MNVTGSASPLGLAPCALQSGTFHRAITNARTTPRVSRQRKARTGLVYLYLVVDPTNTNARLDTHTHVRRRASKTKTQPARLGRIRAEVALSLPQHSGLRNDVPCIRSSSPTRLGSDLSCYLRALPTGQLCGHSVTPSLSSRSSITELGLSGRSPSPLPPIECIGRDAARDWPMSADLTRSYRHAPRACVAVQKMKKRRRLRPSQEGS